MTINRLMNMSMSLGLLLSSNVMHEYEQQPLRLGKPTRYKKTKAPANPLKKKQRVAQRKARKQNR